MHIYFVLTLCGPVSTGVNEPWPIFPIQLIRTWGFEFGPFITARISSGEPSSKWIWKDFCQRIISLENEVEVIKGMIFVNKINY